MKPSFFSFLSPKKFINSQGAPGSSLRRNAVTAAACALLFCASFWGGRTAAQIVSSPASGAVPVNADGNWGLSFQQEGQTPVGNAKLS